MVKFRFQKTSQVPERFFKKRKEIQDYVRYLTNVLNEKNYEAPESFLIFPQHNIYFKDTNNFSLILLCGIGGSSLGTQAIFEALKNKKPLKEILILDSLNPLFIKKAISKAKVNKGNIALFFVSKSGKTFESVANFFTIFKMIKKYGPKVFVISAKNSLLFHFGKRNKFFTFEIPQNLGGRYSVFSNAGILPLSFLGVNVKELLYGAKKANEICLNDDPLSNPALSSAFTIFYHYQKGKNIYSNFVFPSDLEYFGKWYAQLMGESLGKDGKGITPILNVGTNDFHAIGQLYFDGPRDKLINFIFVENLGLDFKINGLGEFSEVFSGITRTNVWEINKAIFEGVKKVYSKQKLPFTETILDKLDEQNLGFLFQMKMIEIIFLAKLMKVNAFDQPAVDLYKNATRNILSKKRWQKLKKEA